MIARAALLALGLAIAPAASADDLPGAWMFTTEPTAFGCTISGEMTIKQLKDGKYACTFTGVQTCTERLPKEMRTIQSCTAIRTGKQVEIKSRLDRLTSVDPPSMLEGAEYAPDDFSLLLSASGDEMTGKYSSHRTSPAKFWRKRELIS